ncbi:MAG: hypothetical protein A2Y38_22095 [Spirochaetes bacterium GWB1_59_5]|nr:MAG: hypothetical protein A2Y38_22095 [Spirochaetes bacterium GWB1_59_5]
MKRAAFFLAYFLTPAIPAFFYINAAKSGFGVYSSSVLLGITAFILLCNQFILAARPGWVVSALGLKSLLAFHGTMPLVILVMAGMHRGLKASAGFPLDSAQAIIGSLSFLVFVLAAIFAILFLANISLPVAAGLRALRKWAQDHWGFSYKLARSFHNITVVAGVAIMVHVLLASSSDFTANPVGVLWMIAWLLMSLGLYARYRLRGRKVPAARASA